MEIELKLLLCMYCLKLSLGSLPIEINIVDEYQDENLIRHTTEGPVLGEKRKNSLSPENTYYAFHGIPYAAPPIQFLRFMPPKRHGKFKEIYDASNSNDFRKCCTQWTPKSGVNNVNLLWAPAKSILKTSEDCLFLSVYTTVTKSMRSDADKLLPVIVWIHGGGLLNGCGMFPDHGPDRFIKGNDIVMVSINYRLGLFGFLSLADKTLPGNMGLLDQVMALQWVQRNIEEFGGDPRRVTIMGESAGSWSVLYHIMSPRSKTLFHQAIGQSGTVASSQFREYTEDEARRWGQKVVESVGCGVFQNITEQIKCLQEIDVKTLASSPIQNGFNGANAVVDGKFSKKPFLPDHPKKLMESGNYNKNINLLLGCNRDEGLLFTKQIINNETGFDTLRAKWKVGYGALVLFGIENGRQNEKILEGVNNITEFYLGNLEHMNIIHTAKVTEMITDSSFCYGMHDFVSRHLPHAPANSILQYRYVHEGQYSMGYSRRVFKGPYGVAHGDETFLQFYPYYRMKLPLNKADISVSNKLLELWKNFVKSGNASTLDVQWIPIQGASSRRYLRLTYAASSYMEYSKEWEERMNIWDEVSKEIDRNTNMTRFN